MATAKIGLRVSADISILRPDIGSGLWTPGKIVKITPERITVRTDAPFNGEDLFEVPPQYVEPLD